MSLKKRTGPSLNTEPSVEMTGVSTKQTLMYIAIVVACFVVVYPRMIHPMIKIALGFGEKPESANTARPGEGLKSMLFYN